jgi:phage tail-like protein
MSQGTDFPVVASAPIFTISAPELQISGQGIPSTLKLSITNMAFQELGGINSEINIETYVSVTQGPNGALVNHSKQMGLTKPPTVTLKRGLDNNPSLWFWHFMALQGMPSARTTVYLEMYGGGIASTATAKPLFTYTLTYAWCPKINISGAKAGESFVTEDITIACDQILYGEASGS